MNEKLTVHGKNAQRSHKMSNQQQDTRKTTEDIERTRKNRLRNMVCTVGGDPGAAKIARDCRMSRLDSEKLNVINFSSLALDFCNTIVYFQGRNEALHLLQWSSFAHFKRGNELISMKLSCCVDKISDVDDAIFAGFCGDPPKTSSIFKIH